MEYLHLSHLESLESAAAITSLWAFGRRADLQAQVQHLLRPVAHPQFQVYIWSKIRIASRRCIRERILVHTTTTILRWAGTASGSTSSERLQSFASRTGFGSGTFTWGGVMSLTGSWLRTGGIAREAAPLTRRCHSSRLILSISVLQEKKVKMSHQRCVPRYFQYWLENN